MKNKLYFFLWQYHCIKVIKKRKVLPCINQWIKTLTIVLSPYNHKEFDINNKGSFQFDFDRYRR